MSVDNDLLEVLLSRTEGDVALDFKVKQYRFDSEWQRSSFVKDMISMANTPRVDSAFIVVGVAEDNGRPTKVVGVKDHFDPSELDRQMEGRLNSVPTIEYHIVEREGCEVGLYEIKVSGGGPYVSHRKFGKLDPGTIYFRRNSQNVAATFSQDIERITSWFADTPPSEPSQRLDSSSWQQFHRACDGFDDRRAYVCVIDDMPQATTDDWQAFGSMGWDLIIDFDTQSDQSGAFVQSQDALGKLRSLKFTPLDGELPAMGPGATLWVAANGVSSRPSTVTSDGWREWHRSKRSELHDAIDGVAKLSGVKPTTLIVFSGDSSYIRTVCEQVDSTFRDRVEFVFANPDENLYSESIEMFDGSHVPISFGDACHYIRDVREVDSELSEIEIPRLGGGVAVIPPEYARWIEEEFELVHLSTAFTPEITQAEITGFHQGMRISWYGLNAGIDIHRDLLAEVEKRILDGLGERSVRRIDLSHWPGGGGSTLGRRIAWNVHQTYPAIIAHTINPNSNLDRIRYLFDITNQPVLVVVDSPSATATDIDRLFDLVRGSNVWALILRVARYYGEPSPSRPSPFLDAMLSTPEAVALEERLATLVPGRRNELHKLLDIKDRRRRTPFSYGLAAYGRGFQGIESYVSRRLSRCSDDGRLVCLMAALAYHYGQKAIPVQIFASPFGLPQSRVLRLGDILNEFVEDLFIASGDTIRPVHEIIAEEILKQLIGQGRADESWRTGLADAAITLAEVCAEQSTGFTRDVSEILQTIFLQRATEELDSEFSRLVSDIPSRDAQERVLTRLTELFPYEAHFWAHLGRFRSRVIRNHARAREAHNIALELAKDDPTLHHMAGMSVRAELYDCLGSPEWTDATEDHIGVLAEEAAEKFSVARELDRRNEHGYIAHVQMLERIINTAAIRKGFRYETHRFLATPNNTRYLRLLDQAESLLVELTVARGGDSPSRYETRIKSALHKIYGEFSKAIEGWTNLLSRTDVRLPPVRRSIINAYLARKRGDWSSLTARELERILELAEHNLAEESGSDQNLRLWFRAARMTGCVSLDRAAETLGIRKLRSPTTDTLYYLYILKFLQADEGALSMTEEARDLIGECKAISVTNAFPRIRPFEWLGKQSGLQSLVNVAELGEWDPTSGFWSNETLLRRVPGTVRRIQGPASGEIELANGLKAFFVPSRVNVEGGYVRGLHEGRRVEFYLGFSYEGLRAWSVTEAA